MAARRPRRPCGRDGPAQGVPENRADLGLFLGSLQAWGDGFEGRKDRQTGQKILFS